MARITFDFSDKVALVTGAGAIAASILFGALYRFDHGRVSFITSAALAALASVAMHSWARRKAID